MVDARLSIVKAAADSESSIDDPSPKRDSRTGSHWIAPLQATALALSECKANFSTLDLDLGTVALFA